jgi:hypothetical protein
MARKTPAFEERAWQFYIDLPLTTGALQGLLERLKTIIDKWEAGLSAVEILKRRDDSFYRTEMICVRVGRDGLAHLKLGDRKETIDVSDLIYLDNHN